MIPGIEAPAKINLGLHVLRRRPDGYHDIETIFFRIGWCDHLSVSEADNLSLSCNNPQIPVDESNLCLRAAAVLRGFLSADTGASIHLDKHIPHGAGLGGGSSDAAATLRLLSRLWRADLSESVLLRLASEIGSDVPFFLGPNPALGTGRGDIIRPFQGPSGFLKQLHIAVIMPDVSISTRQAYSRIKPGESGRPDLLEVFLSADLDRWQRELMNDFEEAILPLFPVISRIKSRLLEMGAGYAAMSGSGAAVFGLFETAGGASEAADHFDQPGWRTWTGDLNGEW